MEVSFGVNLPEVGIYKIMILRNKERKKAFDQETSKIQEKRKKTRFWPKKNIVILTTR